MQGSNLRPFGCKPNALPTELIDLSLCSVNPIVRMRGFEPPRLSAQLLGLLRMPVPPHPLSINVPKVGFEPTRFVKSTRP